MTTITYTRPWLYPEQEAAIFCAERYGLIEASTKSGKTLGSLIWLTEQAMQAERRGQNYWWIAPIYKQAKDPYSRLKEMLPKALRRPNETELYIELVANRAKIWFKGSEEPDSLYGADVYAAVIDEASRCREEAWHAVRSTLTATQGPIRFIGNVKGRKNWFYKLARMAEAGEPNMHYARINARQAVAAGVFPESEITEARRMLPANVFRELYEAIPSDDSGCPFGTNFAPLSTQPVVAWGWDLAKKQDHTVGIGLDAAGHVAAFLRFQRPWGETLETIRRVTTAPALVDSTGVGDPIFEALQKADPTRFYGFTFSGPSKQKLMEGLAAAIDQKQVAYPEDSTIAKEIELFEYENTRLGVHYSAPSGAHDDCVCALALAVECKRGRVRQPVYGCVEGLGREDGVPTWRG